jgi:hypothetical protein
MTATKKKNRGLENEIRGVPGSTSLLRCHIGVGEFTISLGKTYLLVGAPDEAL